MDLPPLNVAALNPSASPHIKKEDRSESTPKLSEPKAEVKQEPRDSTSEESKCATSKNSFLIK